MHPEVGKLQLPISFVIVKFTGDFECCRFAASEEAENCPFIRPRQVMRKEGREGRKVGR